MEDHENQTESPPAERILCHNCLAENPVNANFCTACHTQLSTYAAYDPLMQITASGDTYIKATSGRPSWIKTVGISLIFGPLCLYGLLGLLTVTPESFQSFSEIVSFVVSLAQFFIGAYVILKAVARSFLPKVK